MSQIKHFNIRVYAIIENLNNEILISDEFFNNVKMTKFPGGGLEFGEGTVDCLKREAIEEFGQEIEIISHYYTTDYYQKALFFEDHQLLSIYYKAKFKNPPVFKISIKPFDFKLENGNFSFRWIKKKDLIPDLLTFPIDKVVAKMIIKTDDMNKEIN